MRHNGLVKAKKSKADEFYTQFIDIEKEINAYLEYNSDIFKNKIILLPCDDPEWSNFTKYFAQNFDRLKLKKIISTSYAQESKNLQQLMQPTLFEVNHPKFDIDKSKMRGKIFKLEHDKSGDGKIDINDLEWEYLEGDGNFQSDEVRKLRDEADIIVTNPPFSLFRDFVEWINQAEKQFLIIGNINAITYKEVFPLIRDNKAWLGTGMGRWISGFIVPQSYDLYGSETKIDNEGNRIVATNNCLWLTNIDHGKRHQPLPLMSLEDNIKFSSHKEIRSKEYKEYDNFNALEIPYTDAIPSDYEGVMGVPITFLDKYSPEQFEILGCSYDYGRPLGWDKSINMSVSIDGKNIYKRLLIQHKK